MNKLIWFIATLLIVISGIYFSIKLKFIQFRFIRMIKSLRTKNIEKNTISPFASLMMVLAGRIGVGSIAGVAISIYYGGVGSIFWMWLISILATSLTFVETLLGMKYQKKDSKYICKGGPSYYIRYGLNNKLLGTIYALLILISDIFGFISIQANTIIHSLDEILNINEFIIGVIIASLILLIIIGGAKRIANFSEKIVPIITIFYLLVCLFIIIININKIPSIIKLIFISAINNKSIKGGILGSMIIGAQRGIFSSEAGIGTGAIASSTTLTTTKEEQIRNSYIQMLGIYITTFLICTSTAFIILTSDINLLSFNNLNGIELVQLSFLNHIGTIGKFFVFIIIFAFSFTTILSSYYNGESSLKYFIEKPKLLLMFLKLLTFISIIIGSISKSNFIWNLIDIFVGLLAIINIYAIIKLKDEVFELLKIK